MYGAFEERVIFKEKRKKITFIFRLRKRKLIFLRHILRKRV